MIAAELLAEARAAGVVLTLGVRLQGVCSPGMRSRLKAQEQGLLACLVAEAASQGSADRRTKKFPDDARKGSSGSSGTSGGPQDPPSGPPDQGASSDEAPVGSSGGSSAGSPMWAVLPADADPARPPAGWSYVGSGGLAGCWLGPNGELAPAPRGANREAPR